MTPEELKAKFWPWLVVVGHDRAPAGQGEDYAQEGLISIWTSLQGDEVPDNITGWGKVVAKNRMNALKNRDWAQVRDSRRSVPMEDMTLFDSHSPEPLPEERVTSKHQAVRDVVAGLSDLQREYVELRFWGGYSTEDLAQHYGRGKHSRDIWKSAKRRLTKQLAEAVA